MRISDWSSDVCSSDLGGKLPQAPRRMAAGRCLRSARFARSAASVLGYRTVFHGERGNGGRDRRGRQRAGDRKSVVEGKRVSVRVDLGGRRIFKKKTFKAA